jgi:hypothetical protein
MKLRWIIAIYLLYVLLDNISRALPYWHQVVRDIQGS